MFSIEEDDCDDVGDVVLDVIGADLRKVVPLDAQLPSERIVFPEVGEVSGSVNESGLAGRLTLNFGFRILTAVTGPFCTWTPSSTMMPQSTGCRLTVPCRRSTAATAAQGTRNLSVSQASGLATLNGGCNLDLSVAALTSHSMSKKTLSCIFRRYLPPLDGKMVLDVGSRAGAVLYGAFAYSTARSIIGVEMNGEWARLSGEAVLRHSMRDRVQVIHSDIRDRAHDLSVADVVVMNNVFEFFTDAALQQQLWSFIRSTVRKGALLVTVPAVDKSLSVLSTGINVTEWLSPLPINSDAGDACNDDDVHIYKVQ